MLRENALTGLLVFVAAFAFASPSMGETPDGATVYSQNCGRCHQFRSPIEFNDARWTVIVSHMRVVSGLPADQARAVRDYLITQNNPPKPPPEEKVASAEPMSIGDLVERGKQLIDGKGCRGCHTIGGKGGAVGPKLDTVFERRDRKFVERKIVNPRESNAQSLMPVLGFSNTDAQAIAEYLVSTQK